MHIARRCRAVEEFGDHHSRDTVERLMDDSVRALVGDAQVEDFLPALAHRFTRERLKALARASGPEHASPGVGTAVPTEAGEPQTCLNLAARGYDR